LADGRGLISHNGLINTQNLPTFKHNAVLINASRGGIVDENALIAHMNNDSEMVYIADAVENEPHVNPALLAERNVIVTPHIASLTSDAEKAMLDLALKNFLEQKAVTVS
jgi:gluconate 2-dehydrogenase